MSSVVISGDTSGTVTLTVPSAAGSNTATLPAATGTVMVSGNIPAFSARRATTTQTGIASNTPTKVQLNAEDFDTANAFDSTTNYRFTPQVAGYYQISAAIYFTGATITLVQALIRKNGADTLTTFFNGPSTGDQKYPVSGLVYLNGSTDYIELFGAATGGTVSFGIDSFLTGFLARAA